MQESDTFLAILDEGREDARREDILLIGAKMIGPPDDTIKAKLKTIADLDRLSRMVLCTVAASSWQEILDTP